MFNSSEQWAVLTASSAVLAGKLSVTIDDVGLPQLTREFYKQAKVIPVADVNTISLQIGFIQYYRDKVRL